LTDFANFAVVVPVCSLLLGASVLHFTVTNRRTGFGFKGKGKGKKSFVCFSFLFANELRKRRK
jgi:xanthine dehydrogenase molybdopterin-binding subunit B